MENLVGNSRSSHIQFESTVSYLPNFIEIVWAWAKAHHRSTCTYKYNDLKTGLPGTFDELMPISFVRKAFDHCLRFMHGYRSGLVGLVLEYAVKKYKSHCRLSPNIRLDEIASEFAEKKVKKMTFSRCRLHHY